MGEEREGSSGGLEIPDGICLSQGVSQFIFRDLKGGGLEGKVRRASGHHLSLLLCK